MRTVIVWGDDWAGQTVPPAGTFQQVSAGTSHTCAVTTDRFVECWGDNGHGQASPP